MVETYCTFDMVRTQLDLAVIAAPVMSRLGQLNPPFVSLMAAVLIDKTLKSHTLSLVYIWPDRYDF